MTTRELLRTGEVAQLLGCSRQHVVDLCDEGKLECQSTGVHRRIPRGAVEVLRRSGLPRREEQRSLWLNRAVAGRLARDPDRGLAIARRNLERLRRIHVGSPVELWLDEWQRVVDSGPEEVMCVLTSSTSHAHDLRQNSPFAGVLSASERQQVLDSFRRHWTRSAA